jgi:hypothetical protein
MVSIELDRELLRELQQKQLKTAELDEIIGFHQALIEARVQVEPVGGHLEPDEHEAKELIDSRVPLLQRWELQWGNETFTRLCARGCSFGARHQQDLAVQFGSARGEVEAVGIVTHRFKPFNLNGGPVHQVGMPWHYGWQGLAEGATANDITPQVCDGNTAIPEYKAFLVDIGKVA